MATPQSDSERPEMRSIVSATMAAFPHVRDESAILDIKDMSKGCDNLVFAVTLLAAKDVSGDSADLQNTTVVWRCPKKKLEDQPHRMHRISYQAEVLRRLAAAGVAAPRLLYEDPAGSFLFETYLGTHDALFAFMCDHASGPGARNRWRTAWLVGADLRRMHENLKASGFGYMQTDPPDPFLTSSYAASWHDFLDREIEDNCTPEMEEEKLLLYELRRQAQKHTAQVTPSFVHCDLDGANCRVRAHVDLSGNADVRNLEYAGIIDFADGICGDPLYDLAQLWHLTALDDLHFARIFTPLFQGYFEGIEATLPMLKAVALYAALYSLWKGGQEACRAMVQHGLAIDRALLARLTEASPP